MLFRSPHYFSAGAFRCAVRAKLGVGPTSEALESIRHCPCTIVYNTGLKPFHALSCRLNGATRTRRHHRVVQALAALIRHTQPGPVIVVGNTTSGGEIRADLTWTQPEGRLIIDVAVVDTGADKYTKLSLRDKFSM